MTAERTALPDGYYRINGRLYRVQDGMFLHNTTVDGFTYDAQGRYTTGSATLDTKLNNIVETLYQQFHDPGPEAAGPL